MDLIKLMGSASVSRNLFHLPPGMTVLNLQNPFCLQITYSSLLLRAVRQIIDTKCVVTA